jgi:hypothetical protein
MCISSDHCSKSGSQARPIRMIYPSFSIGPFTRPLTTLNLSSLNFRMRMRMTVIMMKTMLTTCRRSRVPLQCDRLIKIHLHPHLHHVFRPVQSPEPVDLNPPKYTGESQMNYILRTVFNKEPTAPGGVWAPGGRFGQGGEDTSGGNHIVHTPVDPRYTRIRGRK